MVIWLTPGTYDVTLTAVMPGGSQAYTYSRCVEVLNVVNSLREVGTLSTGQDVYVRDVNTTGQVTPSKVTTTGRIVIYPKTVLSSGTRLVFESK